MTRRIAFALALLAGLSVAGAPAFANGHRHHVNNPPSNDQGQAPRGQGR